MPRRRARSRRSAQEWIVRLMMVAAALLAGYVAATFSLARLIYRSDPMKGYLLASYDGRITAALAASMASEGASAADRQHADDLAQLALRKDPTAVSALSTLGLNSEVRGDVLRARTYFSAAQRLSRRNLATQLWSIEDAVRRGDVLGTLKQYDISLRVLPNLWEILFPVLASASTNAAIQPALTKTLLEKPSWGAFFLEYLANNSPDPLSTTKLFVALQKDGQSPSSATQAIAVKKLISRGLFDDAWSYYTTIHPGVDRRRSRSFTFAPSAGAASLFDWQSMEDDGVVATLQGGILDFSVPASSGGPILRQMQLLPAGVYRLEGRSIGIDPASDGRSYWSLTCQDGRENGRVPLVNPQNASGLFSGTFTVGPDCPVQTLVFVARPSDATGRFVGQIDRVRLIPAR